MDTNSLPSPAYQFALRQLKNEEYTSVHSCFFEYVNSEPEIWQNEEHSKEEILKAVSNFKKTLICL